MQKIGTVDYSYFINTRSSRRRPAITRELTKRMYNAPKDMISLAEGMPNELTFPIKHISVTLNDGTKINLEGQELGAALQYIPTQGYPPLVKTLKDFMCKVHQPPNWENTELIVTTGSQDGISKSMDMCLEDGDAIVVQDPLYSGAEIAMKPYNPEIISVGQDQHGMVPQKLLQALKEWEVKCKLSGGVLKMPKLMYLNPTGSNPTGTTMPAERRKEIYKICCDYNIVILEDDAYCFLHFLDESPPSFLSLDTEGRVIRFDSFSKVLSAGLRLGWITGPKALLHNLELHVQSSYLHSSTLSQAITDRLLNTWGFDRLFKHFKDICAYYKVRRDCTLASMDRHLKGLCEWNVPTGGMFVWIKVKGVSDVYEMITNRGIKKHIVFAPGHAFTADPTKACNYIRGSFSKTCPKQIDKAMKLLAELIKEEQVLLRRKLENCT